MGQPAARCARSALRGAPGQALRRLTWAARAAPGRCTPAGPARASALCPPRSAWLQRGGEGGEGPRPSPRWRPRDAGQTQSFPPFPRRVPLSLPHLRECSDFIKVIFQEIASGSQVTARSAPERRLLSTPFFAHPVPVKGKEQNRSLFGDCLAALYTSWRGEARREGRGLRAAWPRARAWSRLARRPLGWGAQGHLERKEARVEASAGARGELCWRPGLSCSWAAKSPFGKERAGPTRAPRSRG